MFYRIYIYIHCYLFYFIQFYILQSNLYISTLYYSTSYNYRKSITMFKTQQILIFFIGAMASMVPAGHLIRRLADTFGGVAQDIPAEDKNPEEILEKNIYKYIRMYISLYI